MNDKQGLINDAIRTVFGAIDWILFSFLDWMYRVFFDISTVELLTGETIRNFFSRIQLILGVFMVFKISISVLQAIVDPDRVTDKSNGFSAYIKRIIICLIMLTLLIPRNIPNARNEYEVQINNNGLLFGTLYSLQGRILKNNTLGKLVLGKSTGNVTLAEGSDNNKNYGNEQAKSMKEMGNEFTVTILKGFVQRSNKCSNFDDIDAGKTYNSDSVNETQILMDHINAQCKSHYYAYMYYPIIGGVVAAVFAVILIGFSIDIAVRALKLALLRLLAPIPIISYLDPNQEKKGAFANWVKILTATYLDLFIRLSIIYFVIFLINDIKDNGIVMGTDNDTFMNVIVFIVICFGLFFFAKQAPKFIKDILGVQNPMSNIGLASILGGTAMAMNGGGLAGFAYGAMNGAKGQVEAQAQGKAVPLGAAWSSNRDLMEKIKTGDKDAQGGVFGKVQDYMNYKVRDNAMSKLGYSRENLALANWNKKSLGGQLTQVSNDYEDAIRDLEHFENTADKTAPTYQQQYQTKVDNIKKLRDQKQDLEDKAEKAAKNAKTIEDRRAQNGAGPRIIDDVLYKTAGVDAQGNTIYVKNDDQYRDNFKVVDNDVVVDQNGLPANIKSNFTTDSNGVDPFKGQSGRNATGGNTNRVDDDAINSSRGGAAGSNFGGNGSGGRGSRF